MQYRCEPFPFPHKHLAQTGVFCVLLLCLLAASAVAYTHPTTRIYGVVGFALAAL